MIRIEDGVAKKIATELLEQDPDFMFEYLETHWDLFQDVIKNYLIGASIEELEELIISAENEIEEKQLNK